MPSKRGVNVQWYLGCSTVKEREARKELLSGTVAVFDVLNQIIDREKQELQSVREADYDASSWAFKQAHMNGRLEQLDRFSNLLRSVTDQDEL